MKIKLEYGQKVVDEEQFLNAIFEGIKHYLYTDTTDYDNFVGIREMGRYMWRNLDKRTYAQKHKLSLKTTVKIEELVQEEINNRFKKIFWKIYKLKNPNTSGGKDDK